MITPADIVDSALSRSGDCDLAVIVSHTAQVNLRWAASSLTTNGDTRATQVDVVAMHPKGGDRDDLGPGPRRWSCGGPGRARDRRRTHR